MSAGNVDLGINLWVEKNGDLMFYLFSEMVLTNNGK
jgi:hypothetical protein